MAPIVWTDDLSVGIKVYDDEHKQLVYFINRLDNALQIRSTQKTMEDILSGLVNYTRIHFRHEEEAMLKFEYPDYVKHKKEHDNLTSKVSEFDERLKSGKSVFSLELMNFLSNWLINHIQKTDMSYKKFFSDKVK